MTGEVSIRSLGFFVSVLALLLPISPSAALASPVVLYDQTSGVPGGLVASQQSVVAPTNDCLRTFPNQFDAQDCIAADDFTVPAGPAWSITGIRADGAGGVGDRFKYELFKDVAGLPFSSSSAQLGRGEGPGPKSGSGDIAFKSKAWGRGLGVLPPGNYWLSVYADGLENESSATSWYWQAQSPQVGREAAWLKTCGGSGSGEERWSYLSACGQSGPDLRFRLEGERMTRSFGKFRLGKPKPKHNGGFTVYGTFPGPGKLTLTGVGKAGRKTVEARDKPVIASTPVPIQINPTPEAKRALKAGKKLRVRVAISYVRAAGIRKQGPAYTRTLALALDKP